MGTRDADAQLLLHSKFSDSSLHDQFVSLGLCVTVDADEVLFDAATRTENRFIFLREEETRKLVEELRRGESPILRRILKASAVCSRANLNLVVLIHRGIELCDSDDFNQIQELLADECLVLPTADEAIMCKIVTTILAFNVGQIYGQKNKPPNAIAGMCKQLTGINNKAVLEVTAEHSLAELSKMPTSELSTMKNLGKISAKKLYDFFQE